jgi:hypothetical protein
MQSYGGYLDIEEDFRRVELVGDTIKITKEPKSQGCVSIGFVGHRL